MTVKMKINIIDGNISEPIINRLLRNEPVKCLKCGKGYYKPLSPQYKVNQYYYCPSCGDKFHIEPNMEVD